MACLPTIVPTYCSTYCYRRSVYINFRRNLTFYCIISRVIRKGLLREQLHPGVAWIPRLTLTVHAHLGNTHKPSGEEEP